MKKFIRQSFTILLILVSLFIQTPFVYAQEAPTPDRPDDGGTTSDQTTPTDSDAYPIDELNYPYYSGNTSGAACGALNSGDVQAVIFNYLIGKTVKGKQLTDFQVAGIMGNMWAESGYQPQRLQGTPSGTVTPADQAESSSLGWGLVQWTPAGKMITPTKQAGKDPNDIIVQLDFLLGLLNGGGPDGTAGELLVNTTNVADATVTFETKYERHSGPPQPERIVEAQRVLDEVDRSGASAGGTCNGGGLADTTLLYAWPQYHEPPYPQKKPEYETAIQTAMSNGQYVGGGQYPGVDCGGWVTRLMIDSGWEPNYNFAGKVSDGAGNVSGGQIQWIQANWDKISVNGTQDLKPGDVAINLGRSHTFAFVGNVPGFDSEIASASYSTTGQSWRAPMAGKEDPLASNLEWYRKRGQ